MDKAGTNAWGNDMNYLVVDVETPNEKNDSICAIGVQTIDDGIVTGEWSTLVNPEAEFYSFNISIHGILPEMVEGAPRFPEVWEKVKEYSRGRVFVAHNAPFDITVLSKCIRSYALEPFIFSYLDTVRLGRKLCSDWPRKCGAFKLPNMSARLGVTLENHHDAMADARACGGILLKLLDIYNFDPAGYLSRYSSECGRLASV